MLDIFFLSRVFGPTGVANFIAVATRSVLLLSQVLAIRSKWLTAKCVSFLRIRIESSIFIFIKQLEIRNQPSKIVVTLSLRMFTLSDKRLVMKYAQFIWARIKSLTS